MALFGPKDAKLSKLTTIFQVDEPAEEFTDDTELFRWLVREKQGSRPPMTQKEHSCFKRLIDIRRLVRLIMASLEERQEVSRQHLVDLHNIYRAIPENQMHKSLYWNDSAIEKTQGADIWIDPRIVRTSSYYDLPFDHQIGQKIIEEIVKRMATPEQFAKCPECQSVFVRTNPRAIFCSHRDRNRAMVHRFNARKADERVTAKAAVEERNIILA